MVPDAVHASSQVLVEHWIDQYPVAILEYSLLGQLPIKVAGG